jgi:deoxyribodipyrimidine photolyase
VQRELESFADSLDALHQTLVVTEGGWISGKEELRERLGALYGAVTAYEGRPSESQLQRMRQLGAELEAAQARFETQSGDLAARNRSLEKNGLEPLQRLSREAWEARQEGAAGSAAAAAMGLGALLAL